MKKLHLGILFLLLLILCSGMVMTASAASTLSISSPKDNSVVSWEELEIKWNKVTDAAGYYVTILDQNTGDYLVQNKYTTSRSFDATAYLPNEHHSLKIWVGAVKTSSQAGKDAFTSDIHYVSLAHEPAVTIGGSSGITGNSAVLEMSVDLDYQYAIEDCGFYVGTSSSTSKMEQYSFWDYSTSYGATSKGTKYMTIPDLDPSTKYYYRAYAVNAAGEAVSNYKSFKTTKGSLGKPVITYPGDRITCYTGSDITLEWNSVSGADSYKYHIKQLSGTPNTNETDEAYVNKWEGSTTTSKRYYTLDADDLVPGYWYKFVVEACADDADSGWSAWHYVYVEKGSLEKAKIVSPSNTATYPGYQSIKFDWDAVPGADSYNYHIKRLANIPDRTNNDEPSIGEPWTGKTTSTSYTLSSSNVIPGSWYKFVVEAVSDTANPSWSEWVYCYIEEVKLEDPEIIKPTEWTEIYEGDSVVVDWDSVSGADGYRCHIKQLAGKPDTSNNNEPAVFSLKEDCGTTTKYTLPGSKVHGGYWYKFVVEAYSKSGTSTWSDWVYVYVPEKGTLDRATISSPSDSKVYKWGEDILFTWAKVPNATNYTYYVKQLKGDPDYSSDEAAINSWSGTTNATNRFFTLPGDQVLPDVWYKFVVKAEADGYDSSWSKYTYIQIPDREDWIHTKLNTSTSVVMAEAFASNERLRTFDASESCLETIGARAFENCVNLRSIFLPSSVSSIADNTFSNCPQLTIHCYKDSYVHQYAVKKNIPVVLYGVVEQADMIELSKDSWAISFSEAAQAVFTVSSTGKWTATSSASWLTLSATSGLNATNVIFKAAANTGNSARTATVTFTCGKATATVTVSQSSVSGKACTMVLNHTSWMPSSSDLTREIVVKSEKGFTVSSNKTWLKCTTENAAIHAEVTSSALNTTQTGILTVTCKKCGKAQTVTVAIKSVPAPTGVTAESSEPHAVVISWDKVADATYTLERSTDGGNSWKQIAKNLTSTEYTDGDPNYIAPSTTYYYRVTACKGSAYSAPSKVVQKTTEPALELTFTGTVGDLGDNDRTSLSSLSSISWTGLFDATYELTVKDISTTPNTYINGLEHKNIGSGTTYSLSGLLTEGHTYQVWVGAYNKAGRPLGQAKVKTFSVISSNTPKPTITINSVTPASVENSGNSYFAISFTATNASTVKFDFGNLIVQERWDKDDKQHVAQGEKSVWTFDGGDIGTAYSYDKTTWTAYFYPKADTPVGTYSFTLTAQGNGGSVTSDSYQISLYDDSNARDLAIAEAEYWYNYEWETAAGEYILMHYNSAMPTSNGANTLGEIKPTFSADVKPRVATGKVRGIPYSLSSNTGGEGIETSPSYYKDKTTVKDRLIVSKVFQYKVDGVFVKRVGPKFGMSCATYVSNCIRAGFGNKTFLTAAGTSTIYANNPSYVTPGEKGSSKDYARLQKGDYLYKGGHVMLVGGNDGSNILIYEQTPPNSTEYTKKSCQNLKNVTATLVLFDGSKIQVPARQLCMTCAGCQEATLGTRMRTISINSSEIKTYQPMFVRYPANGN